MEAVHLLSLSIAILGIAMADKQAFSWMTGKAETLPKQPLHLIHNIVWLGLIGLITSGAIMAYPMIDYLIKDPAFIVKMMFVGILITNGFLISSLMKIAHQRSFASLETNERMPLFLSGAVSTISWSAAIIIGFFFL